MQQRLIQWLGCLLLLVMHPVARAHSFGKVYSLPIPLYLYVFAVSMALLCSTVAAVWMLRRQAAHTSAPVPVTVNTRLEEAGAPSSVWALPGLGVLILCMVTAAFGVVNPFINISMNLFWIDFMLVLFYINFFTDDFASLNPWRWLAGRLWGRASSARQAQPGLGWQLVPLLSMLGLFAVELLTHANPRALALFLVVYTLVTLYGAKRWGVGLWFARHDFFQVYFHLFSLKRLRDSKPLTHLELYIVFFVLAMTTFDGLKDTLLWVSIYWGKLYQGVLNTSMGLDYSRDFALLQRLFTGFESLTLIVAPFAYMALFAAFAGLTALLLGRPHQTRELLYRSAVCVIPVVITYHAAHYVSLLCEQALQFVFMLFDPMGWGWIPSVTSLRLSVSWTLPPDIAWHAQVALILLGHAWSGVLLHQLIARYPASEIRTGAAHGIALSLMVLLTTIGLWVLSLPINPN